jgi:hypothetical protein
MLQTSKVPQPGNTTVPTAPPMDEHTKPKLRDTMNWVDFFTRDVKMAPSIPSFSFSIAIFRRF